MAPPGTTITSAQRFTTPVGYCRVNGSFVNSMYRNAVGCSGGGRIGLNVATTHPEDFDGTFAGAPGSVVVFPAFARSEQYLQLHPEAWISPAELTQIDKAVTAAFDDVDGAHDGVVWDPTVVHVDAALLPFLTSAQLAFVRLVMSPVLNPDRTAPYQGAIVPGMSITNTGSWQHYTGAVPPAQWTDTAPGAHSIAKAVYRALFGSDFDYVHDLDMNDQNQMDYYMAYHFATRWPRPTGPQLAKYGAAGNKLLLAGYTSDVLAGYQDVINNYEELVRATGSLEKTEQTTRLFLAPGALHCAGGGAGPRDVQDVMVSARQLGRAGSCTGLGRIEPSGDDGPARTDVPLCPYPQQARFRASGNVNDAGDWACKSHYTIDKDDG